MARSINFNSTDMSAHDLVVTTPGLNTLRQMVGQVKLQDRGYAFPPSREPRRIVVGCAVTGTSLADLDTNLDAIRGLLTLTEPKKLIFDSLSTRYFMAILESFLGEYRLATVFQGTLVFVCPDPLGYSTTLDDNDHTINADPKTISEVVGGTGYVAPIWTLTAGEDLTGVTLKLENETTAEELQWTGDLASAEELEIDVARWLVSKEGSASMATVTGKFPQLRGDVTNSIKVTGLSTTGSLNVQYRDTYL